MGVFLMRSRVLLFLAAIVLTMTIETARAQSVGRGVVYVATNAVAGNSVLVFARSGDGQLTPAGSFSTGGLGTGAGLGNQGGLVLTANNDWLFVVNAGSNEVSVFEVRANGLTLTDKVASGGKMPVSVTFDRDVLYVLNAGGSVGAEDNITGFSLTRHGKLVPLAGSTRPLSAANTGPAEVGFNANGNLLVVTEKNTNKIDIFKVDRDGLATGPFVEPSSGGEPFGFAVGRHNRVFVSEAFGGAPHGSALSSYELEGDAELESISASVPTNQTAACWAVLTPDERFAYVTDTGSATVTGYAVDADGELSRLQADGSSAATGAGPIDAAISRTGRFLFTLNSGAHTITGFRIGDEGELSPVSVAGGIPAGANGLAAR
jgi:6-phosphogluconolactonase